ncbi:MAG: PH domain-containing protein [Proteobacteria bacterium]|nr:PH domain-containing protein [Pseudomonadota bacterium]
MAVAAIGMGAAAVLHFATSPPDAPTPSPADARFVLFTVLAAAMLYYAYIGATRAFDQRPQVVIDRDGILLGFGRNRRFAWSDIQWVRLRRLALRPQLQIGLSPEAFIAADLRLSTWSLDDGLRPIGGAPAAVQVRDNGLDTSATAMLDAIQAFRPNLIKS